LDECRTQYATTGLAKIPDNLRISQMCASGLTSESKIIDACQGKFELLN